VKAKEVSGWAIVWANRYHGVLSSDLIQSIALGYVTKWATQQDESVSRERIGRVVAEAGDLIIKHFALLKAS
jgi:hypothetical protein